jgi:hypothetical protein
MKKFNIKKIFAIVGPMVTGGLFVTVEGLMGPAEAALSMN